MRTATAAAGILAGSFATGSAWYILVRVVELASVARTQLGLIDLVLVFLPVLLVLVLWSRTAKPWGWAALWVPVALLSCALGIFVGFMALCSMNYACM